MTRRVHTVVIAGEAAKVLRLEDLRIPIHFCLGLYEAANLEELDELITDLSHERERRRGHEAA